MGGWLFSCFYDQAKLTDIFRILIKPFNAGYIWQNTSANEVIPNPSISTQNTYTGGVLQQATSVVTETDQNCYEGETGCFSIYGFEVCRFVGLQSTQLTGKSGYSTFLDLITRWVERY